MSGSGKSLAGAGSTYVTHARNKLPLLDHTLEVAEHYIDAACTAMSSEQAADCQPARLRSASPTECKLTRVSATSDLRQLRHTSQNGGIFLRARRTGARLLTRLETFLDNLGTSDEGDNKDSTFDSSSSCSASLISSTEEEDSSVCSQELLVAELMTRALTLPVVLHVQVIGKVCHCMYSAAAKGLAVLGRCTLQCTKQNLRRACRVASRFALCRQTARLVDSIVLWRLPCMRQVIVLAITEENHIREDSQPQRLSNASSDGGTGGWM